MGDEVWRSDFITCQERERERNGEEGKDFVKIVVQNSLQKWVGFNMSGVANVKSWKTCLKVSSKREGPQKQTQFRKGGMEE